MNWVDSFESSTVSRFGYDEANRILTVDFIKGGTYNYFDVPEAVFNLMCDAPSKGQFLAREIKPNYRYARA